MTIAIKEVGTRDLWEQFKVNPMDIYKERAREMKEAGIEESPTLTRVLEEISPTDKSDKSGLDTYERMLQEAGIVTQEDPNGNYHASYGEKFFESAGARVLWTEFASRNWRKASRNSRAVLLNSDGVVGSWERPYYDSTMVRPSQQIAPAIPLTELVGMTTAINSDAYRAFYLTYDATQLRKYRVGETAEIPVATVVGAQREVRLQKYGRGISISYEAMRRMRVDKLAFFIQKLAVQTEIDKVAAALAIIIAGDGNSGTAATAVSQSTLDAAATTGTLSLKAWFALELLFVEPYTLTTALMQKAVALQLRLLNTGTANVPLVVANLGTNLSLINQTGDGVRYGFTTEAPTLKIVAFDKRYCLEMITEIGADISEMERAANNQTQTLYLSEVMGFSVMDGNSAYVLDVNA